jgi:hypothetical protein
VPFKLYWGETHHNTYQQGRQDPPLTEILANARQYLDFYAAAYYMAEQNSAPLKGVVSASTEPVKGHQTDILAQSGRSWDGVFYETDKAAECLEREWQEVQSATRLHNEPHAFVTFPGYEWQGDCGWGDHNVFYYEEGAPIHAVRSLPDLYDLLRGHRAFAIPHHTAYRPGTRAPHWEHCDESISPFAEIFSIHGSSETDGTQDGLRRNGHMGPGVGGSTYESLLALGKRVGVIASTDNWTDCPGQWGHGLMGCWARELTRAGL